MNLGGEDHYGEEEVDEEAAEYLYQREKPASNFDWDVLITSPTKGGKSRGGRNAGASKSGARKKKRGGKKGKAKVDPLIEIRKKEIEELRSIYPALHGIEPYLSGFWFLNRALITDHFKKITILITHKQKVVKGEEETKLPTYELPFDISFVRVKSNTVGERPPQSIFLPAKN